MKKILLIVFFVFTSFLMTAQEISISNSNNSIDEKKFNGISLILLANSQQTNTFNIGENIQPITDKRTVSSFYINAYETTYELWYNIRIQAEKDLGYIFQNPGQEGAGGRRGRAPSEKGKYQPVTTINWRDAIVWCNALSEIEGRTPCYTYDNKILRNSTDAASIDLCICNYETDGYRLPTETEWEYAARKTSSTFQRGDLVSGAVTEEGQSNENALETDYCWNETNSNGTATVATAGSTFGASSNPGSGNPNAMGIFDMSGNVLEFCNDWFEEYYSYSITKTTTPKHYDGPAYGSTRVARGGSWSIFACYCFCGDRYSFDPDESYNYMGFRFCTSKE